MKEKFKSAATLTAKLILLLKRLFPIMAFAAIGVLVTSSWQSDWKKKGFVEINIDVPAGVGGVGPGDSMSMSVSPTLTNSRTDPALAFIKFSYPVLPGPSGAVEKGMSGSAYIWSVGEGWTVVEEQVGYTVYGYNTNLNEYDTMNALMESVTMKDMSGEEYKAIDDVNVRLDGWLADCNEYGEDVGAAWTRIQE